jgi:hypothetical protein
VDRRINPIQSVDTTTEAHVSKTISPSLIEKESGNKMKRNRKEKRSAPPPSNPIPKSMDVISAEDHSSLGRSAKRKHEMAYSNPEGTFYGIKSSRLESPQEFIAKTRKLYRELRMSWEAKSRECSLSTAAALGRSRDLNEPDSAEVDSLFVELINHDIWDCED